MELAGRWAGANFYFLLGVDNCRRGGAGRGVANAWGVVTLPALPGQSACFSFPAAYLAGIADLAPALAGPVTVGHCAGTDSVGLGVAVQPHLCDTLALTMSLQANSATKDETRE